MCDLCDPDQDIDAKTAQYEKLAERVANGAALLDQEVPEWWTLVDLDTFDIDNGRLCVLGQVFRAEGVANFDVDGYTFGHARLRLYGRTSEHGFIATGEDLAPIECAWRTAIMARVANGGGATVR